MWNRLKVACKNKLNLSIFMLNFQEPNTATKFVGIKLFVIGSFNAKGLGTVLGHHGSELEAWKLIWKIKKRSINFHYCSLIAKRTSRSRLST